MLDLLVIGAGLAGLTAALTAAQSGLSVRIISKGMGALHWAAGTIDVMGYTSDGQPVREPLDYIGKLPATHPYSLIGADAVRDSLSWFQNIVNERGLEYVADERGYNTWLPSPAGAQRPAYLAPRTQRGGALADNKPLVIVGFDGMRDFYPDLIANNLMKQDVQARAVHLPISIITERSDYNNVTLAQSVDREEVCAKLGHQLATLAQPGERMGLPAILGYDNNSKVMKELADAAGVDLFEMPTLPPSVPGIRLHRALAKQLEALGVRVEIGMEVINSRVEDSRVQWVETETSARPLRHRATNFLIATGGVLGGGFVGAVEGQLTEVLFGLPLSAPQNRNEWFRPEFLDPRGQPVFQAGVRVDSAFRPLDSSGNPVYENLWCAGNLLTNSDPIQERSLEGISIATGRASVQSLVANGIE